MPHRRRKSSKVVDLTSFIEGETKSINIYKFVGKIHNIIYAGDAAGGIDAAKRVLPVVSYIINVVRQKGGGEEDVVEVVNELLSDARRTKTERLRPFVGYLRERAKDNAVKDFLLDIERTIDGLGTQTLEKILKVIQENKTIQKALLRYDLLGALFEGMVYEAFKGGAGKYLTHRNLVLTMREIAWAQFEAEGLDPLNVKVYDPCAGSARFLTFWLEKGVSNKLPIQPPHKNFQAVNNQS